MRLEQAEKPGKMTEDAQPARSQDRTSPAYAGESMMTPERTMYREERKESEVEADANPKKPFSRDPGGSARP